MDYRAVDNSCIWNWINDFELLRFLAKASPLQYNRKPFALTVFVSLNKQPTTMKSTYYNSKWMKKWQKGDESVRMLLTFDREIPNREKTSEDSN